MTPADLGLEHSAKALMEIERQKAKRLRGSADEFAIGTLLLFLFVLVANFAFRSVEPLQIAVSFCAAVFFLGEWLEVRRLKKQQGPHERRFEALGYRVWSTSESVYLSELEDDE